MIKDSECIKGSLSEYRYRIELHAHTSPVSGCSEIPPEELAQTYKGLGFDAVVITNHFTPELFTKFPTAEECVDYYLSGWREAKAAGDRLGIRVLLAAEYRFTENSNDYLVFGCDKELLTATAGELADGAEAFSSKHRSEKLAFFQAHPFRDRMTAVPPSILDGIETYNMHPNHNSRIGFAVKYAGEKRLRTIAGTDFHHRGHEGLGSVMAKRLPENGEELARLVLENDFLFNIAGSIVLP